MSPFWQLKQVITVDGQQYVNQNLAFGSSDYIDDSSGCNLLNNISHYKPYGTNYPSNQFKLLQIWDELSIPHKSCKQVSGSPLMIIGIKIDPNLMTLTLPNDARISLINKLHLWTSKPQEHFQEVSSLNTDNAWLKGLIGHSMFIPCYAQH